MSERTKTVYDCDECGKVDIDLAKITHGDYELKFVSKHNLGPGARVTLGVDLCSRCLANIMANIKLREDLK